MLSFLCTIEKAICASSLVIPAWCISLISSLAWASCSFVIIIFLLKITVILILLAGLMCLYDIYRPIIKDIKNISNIWERKHSQLPVPRNLLTITSYLRGYFSFFSIGDCNSMRGINIAIPGNKRFTKSRFSVLLVILFSCFFYSPAIPPLPKITFILFFFIIFFTAEKAAAVST